MANQTFLMRGGRSPLYFFLPIGLLLVGLGACFLYFVLGPKKLDISANSLTVNGSFYSTSVARDKLLLDKARVVNLDTESEFSPGSRSNGLDLLSYKEGWFKLHNGDKAFVVVSNSKAVYIPTTAGYSILFSPPDPEKVIAALH